MLLAGQEASPERAAALEKLCRAYWLPICAFARRKGWNEEDAKDLTQQFFVLIFFPTERFFQRTGSRKGRNSGPSCWRRSRTFWPTNTIAPIALKRGGGQNLYFARPSFPPEQLDGIVSADEVIAGAESMICSGRRTLLASRVAADEGGRCWRRVEARPNSRC